MILPGVGINFTSGTFGNSTGDCNTCIVELESHQEYNYSNKRPSNSSQLSICTTATYLQFFKDNHKEKLCPWISTFLIVQVDSNWCIAKLICMFFWNQRYVQTKMLPTLTIAVNLPMILFLQTEVLLEGYFSWSCEEIFSFVTSGCILSVRSSLVVPGTQWPLLWAQCPLPYWL